MQPHTEFEPFRPIEAVVRAVSGMEGATGPVVVRFEAGLAMPLVPDDERTRPISLFVQSTPHVATSDTLAASEANILDAFLASLYEYSKTKERGKGSLLVVKHFDSLMKAGNFKHIDFAMLKANMSRLDPDIGFAFLTITAPARSKLDGVARRFFVASLKPKMTETRSKQYVDDLLRHYE